MKKIPLTQGQEAIVDDWWFDYLMQWKWHVWCSKDVQGFYAVRTEGVKPNRKTVWMHRVVAKTPNGMDCDHIHHITLDNRESELRNVTHAQNMLNRRVDRDNRTGVTGVSIRPDSGMYRAMLTFEGKKVLNKTFKTIKEAIDARKDAEKEYFGEYAKSNL